MTTNAPFIASVLAADRAHTAQMAEINTRYEAADARHAAAHRACRAAHASGDRAAIIAANAEWTAAGVELLAVTREVAAAEGAHYGDSMPKWATYGS